MSEAVKSRREVPREFHRIPRAVIAVFLCLDIAIALGAYLYYQGQREDLTERQKHMLAAIADLKAETIATWLEERRSDAEAVGVDPLISRAATELFRLPAGAGRHGDLASYLTQMKRRHDYVNVLLLDASGNLRLSVNREVPRLAAQSAAAASQAIRERRAVVSDPYYNYGGRPELAIAAVLTAPDQRGPIGAIVLLIDPKRSLYQQVRTWPMPSRTAETLLVRRDGKRVLFLSELRHRRKEAHVEGLPLSRQTAPSVQAVLGREGVMEGLDYRDVKVLAAARKVRNSPWFIVAKVDASEIYDPIRERAWFALLVAGLLIAAVATTVGLLWRQREARFYRQRYRAELKARALESHFEYLHRFANDVILLVDAEGRITQANERACTCYGFSRERMIGMAVRRLRAPDCLAEFDDHWKQAEEPGGVIFETVHRRSDGSTFPAEVSSRTIEIDGQKFRQSIVRDLTERRRAEAELRATHAELAAIHANAPVLLMVVGEDLRVHKVNELAAQFAGLDVSQIPGLLPGNTIGCLNALANPKGCGHGPSCSQCPIRRAALDSLCNGAPHNSIEAWIPMKIDGREQQRCLLVSTAPMHFDEERRTLICAQDMTELRRAEVEVQRRGELLNLSHDAIITASADRVIQGWNAGAREMYGWTEQEAAGQPIHMILQTSSPVTDVAGIDEVLEQQGSWDGELVHVRRDGGKLIVDSRQILVRNDAGAPVGLLEINRDITDRTNAEKALRESEERLRQLNVELEHRVRARTAQLEATNKELESFSYSVSHDLQAPLRGIDGWSSALQEDYSGQLDERARGYLDRVRAETRRMASLIDDLLQLSRLGRAPLDRQNVDLTAIAHAIAGRLLEANAGRRIEFIIQAAVIASGDARLLEVALTNLMDNAAKFTGGRPTARIEFGRSEQNGEPTYYIRDNGVGFDAAYAGKLFGAFQRLHKSSEFPGTGIGLATVRRVIHRHGGRVWAESQVDQGATFYFTIGTIA